VTLTANSLTFLSTSQRVNLLSCKKRRTDVLRTDSKIKLLCIVRLAWKSCICNAVSSLSLTHQIKCKCWIIFQMNTTICVQELRSGGATTTCLEGECCTKFNLNFDGLICTENGTCTQN
jgi:hypothetical protein